METIQFEGIKTGLKQTKEGYILTVAVHPDDLPEDLIKDFVGARYMVVMARLGDDEQPFVRNDKSVAVAGMLCRDAQFWSFIELVFQDEVTTEHECTEWLKIYLDITSRTELKTNKLAREKFMKLNTQFKSWVNS